jgi:hypothetical protein
MFAPCGKADNAASIICAVLPSLRGLPNIANTLIINVLSLKAKA